MHGQPLFEQIDVFGMDGEDAHRIPVIVASGRGTILAFCNRRIGSAADQGNDHHLVLRRSLDGGRTWEPTQVLFARDGWRGGIGNAVVDGTDGSVMILYGRGVTNPEATEKASVEGTRKRMADPGAGSFIARSTDDGATWTHRRLSLLPNADGLKGGTHGSGPATQLKYGDKKGRLVMPARTWARPVFDLSKYTHNCAIYSDDQGATWKTSGLVQAGTGEACIVETVDGRICLNSRQYHGLGRRGVAWSRDGGETFADFSWDQTLVEPTGGGCNASMLRCSDSMTGDRNRVLFANPATGERARMTVRLSFDECSTWPVSKLVDEGPSAYSALAIAQDGTILCFYERGDYGPYEKMTVARFNIEWLAD